MIHGCRAVYWYLPWSDPIFINFSLLIDLTMRVSFNISDLMKNPIHDCQTAYWHPSWSDHESLDLIIHDFDLAMIWFDHVDFTNRDIRPIVILDCVTWSIWIVPHEFSLLWLSLSTWFMNSMKESQPYHFEKLIWSDSQILDHLCPN